MSALKFECPGCGQHLECDRACGGDIIHCPRCCAELRIPFGGSSEFPGAVARAELILHAPAAVPAAPATPPAAATPAVSTAAERQTVICPVCESELRVPASAAAKSDDTHPLAELIRKGQPKEQTSRPAEQSKESHPDLAHMSLEERERQIAAAREAHPIQLNSPIKPRLDYVLSGEAPAPQKAPQKPPDDQISHDGTLTE